MHDQTSIMRMEHMALRFYSKRPEKLRNRDDSVKRIATDAAIIAQKGQKKIENSQ
jgi:hypothetical protein